MDLTYPPEAEQFRKEIRGWLEENLPAGLVRRGLRDDRRTSGRRSTRQWPAKLYEGGWICAVVADRVRRQGPRRSWRTSCSPRSSPGPRRRCGPTSSATRSSARPSSSGAPRSRRRSSCPRSSTGEMALVPGLLRAELGLRPRLAQDHRRARRRRVGDHRPEGLDHAGPVRRLLLPAGPHRPGRDQAQGHLLPARADAAGRHRGPRHHPARRHRRVQRGVLRRRPLPEGERRRRPQQRLGGGQHHPLPRAGHVGHHRLPPLRPGARPDGRAEARANGADRRPARSARAWPATTPRSRSSASTGCAASPPRVHERKDPGVAALGATQQDVLVGDAPRRDGAGARHLRAGVDAGRHRSPTSAVVAGDGPRPRAATATRSAR